MEYSFDKWKNVLWRTKQKVPVAFCPTHKTRLDIFDTYGDLLPQSTGRVTPHVHLVCPVDEESFSIEGDSFWTMRRRYESVKESEQYKDAKYRDLDDVYKPILRVDPKPKDNRYSVQVEIDDTPNGKKMVIYAMDRQNPSEKTQIFIDPQLDKLSFDATNDLHPNMIFSKVVAYFKDDKTATLEQNANKNINNK